MTARRTTRAQGKRSSVVYVVQVHWTKNYNTRTFQQRHLQSHQHWNHLEVVSRTRSLLNTIYPRGLPCCWRDTTHHIVCKLTIGRPIELAITGYILKNKCTVMIWRSWSLWVRSTASHWWPSGLSSNMKCAVMIWRSWVRNPGRVELGVRSTSVPSHAWTTNIY